jgi:hypothetical protein
MLFLDHSTVDHNPTASEQTNTAIAYVYQKQYLDEKNQKNPTRELSLRDP